MIKSVYIPSPLDGADQITEQLLHGDPEWAHAYLGLLIRQSEFITAVVDMLEEAQSMEAECASPKSVANRTEELFDTTVRFAMLRYVQEARLTSNKIEEAYQH